MSGGVRTAGTIMTDSHARSNRLRLALAINLVIVAVQVVLGFVADSLGLLSDAAHNLTDVAGLGLAVYAVQLTRRPATSRRSFGWHRGTILAAQANAAMILALTVWILIEGVRRLLDPHAVDGGIVVVVASVAFVAYLTAMVNPKFAAVQYALLGSLVMLIGSLGRAELGTYIETNGYHDFFILTVWIGMIAVVLAAAEWARQAMAKKPAVEADRTTPQAAE